MSDLSHPPGINKWAFWQISGWYGVWSKYHLFKEKNLTACGRMPYPEMGSDFVWEQNPPIRERCKICEKINKK